MKFSIVRSTFIEGLKAVQNIVSGKGNMAVLQNVLLVAKGGDLEMTTTDIDISIRSRVPCEVKEEGETTLPVKLLATSVLKASEGVIEVEIDENEHAKITAGSSLFRLVGISAKTFPRFAIGEESCEYVLPRQTLHEMLRKTAYAASQDDTRRTLKGILMSFRDEKLTVVATDGRRLALVENEIEFPKSDEKDIILPTKAVQELSRALPGEGNVTIKVQESKICFEIEGVQIYSKLIDDTYPNYRQVIPTECLEKIDIDRLLLLTALDRASVMTIDEAHSTKLIFEANKLTVISSASDIGEAKDEVPIKYAGKRIEIMFNPNYMMDALKAIDDDEVKICLNDGHSPAVIRCSIPFIYVIMPLRVIQQSE